MITILFTPCLKLSSRFMFCAAADLSCLSLPKVSSHASLVSLSSIFMLTSFRLGIHNHSGCAPTQMVAKADIAEPMPHTWNRIAYYSNSPSFTSQLPLISMCHYVCHMTTNLIKSPSVTVTLSSEIFPTWLLTTSEPQQHTILRRSFLRENYQH